MALFTDLHDVAQVLTEHIRAEAGIVDVQPGTPRDVSATTTAGARITLLYTTPQPGHRSDPPERQDDGSRRFPPLSLTCTYLLTTSGIDSDDPVAAHHALGRILSLYHNTPVLQLPLSGGALSALGEGELAVVQLPMMLDQIDKIWTTLEIQLQPWALFEVSPVQLVSPLPDAAPAPAVRPGGIRLGVRAVGRPGLGRITPTSVRAGGRLRVDDVTGGGLEAVRIDGINVPAGDARLNVAAGGSPVLVALDAGGLEALAPGPYEISVQADGMLSVPGVLRIAGAGAPTVDAPGPGPHDPGTDLVLTGAHLDVALDAVLWPDAGVTAPDDIRPIAVADVSPGSVTVASAGGLATAPAGRGPWRLALRVGEQSFTPYVVLELGA